MTGLPLGLIYYDTYSIAFFFFLACVMKLTSGLEASNCTCVELSLHGFNLHLQLQTVVCYCCHDIVVERKC